MPRGIKSEQTDAHGRKVSETVADDQVKEMEELLAADVDVERARTFTSLNLSRMKTEWAGDHRTMMTRIRSTVDGAVLRHFMDAYAIMSDLYDVVREPEVDEATGEVKVDTFGFTLWRRSPTGAYYEDWTRLGIRQREDFLFRVTTGLFEWSQRAADMWGEAMFAKAVWTESFATAFDAPHSGTVDDRTAVGNMKSAEDRYFALYLSYLSRRADSVVSSMERLGQRLKDVSQA